MITPATMGLQRSGRRIDDLDLDTGGCERTGRFSLYADLRPAVASDAGEGCEEMKRSALPTTLGMHHITTDSASVATIDPRAAAGLTGAGLYLVGGWLLLSHLIAGGIGPIDQSAPEAAPAFTSIYDQYVPLVDNRGTTEMRVLIVPGVDQPASYCLVPAYLVANDAIALINGDFAGALRALDCT